MGLELFCVFSTVIPTSSGESGNQRGEQSKGSLLTDLCLSLLLFPLKKKRCVRAEEELKD